MGNEYDEEYDDDEDFGDEEFVYDFMDESSMDYEYMEHKTLLRRFRCFDVATDTSADLKTQVSHFLAVVMADFELLDDVEVGEEQTLFRSGALGYLEELREQHTDYFAIFLQKYVRCWLERKEYLADRAYDRAMAERAQASAAAIEQDGRRVSKSPRQSDSPPKGEYENEQLNRLRKKQALSLQKTRLMIRQQMQKGKSAEVDDERQLMLDEIEALKKANHLLAEKSSHEEPTISSGKKDAGFCIERKNCLKPSESFAMRSKTKGSPRQTDCQVSRPKSSPQKARPSKKVRDLGKDLPLSSCASPKLGGVTPTESFLFSKCSEPNSVSGSTTRNQGSMDMSFSSIASPTRGVTPTESFLFRGTVSPRRVSAVKEIDLASPITPGPKVVHDDNTDVSNTDREFRLMFEARAGPSPVPKRQTNRASPSRKPKGKKASPSSRTPNSRRSKNRGVEATSIDAPPLHSVKNYKEMYERASKNEKSLKAKNRLLKEINDSNEQTIQALHDRIHELSTLQKLQGSVTSDVESQALQACEQTLQDITEIVFHHCKDHKLRQKVSAKYEKYELVAARSVISKPELVEVESSESSAS